MIGMPCSPTRSVLGVRAGACSLARWLGLGLIDKILVELASALLMVCLFLSSMACSRVEWLWRVTGCVLVAHIKIV